jgi:YbbR domain-containing protein
MSLTLTDRLRGALTENINLKLVSIGFTLVLYSLVHGAQDAQRSVPVDLVLLLPPDDANRVLVSPIPPQVRVTLRGQRTALDELHADDVGNLQVDVRSGQDRHVLFDKSSVHVPNNIVVDQIDPPGLDLQWDDVITRDVPVQVTVTGTPASGFIVKGAPASEPPNVRVRGPKGEVTVLQHARADAFDVSGLTEGTYTRSLAIDRPTGHLAFDVRSVSVTTHITRELAEKTFTKIPVVVVGQAKAKTTPADVDIRLSCPPDIVHALRPEQLLPRVEESSTAATGSESHPVIVTVDKCEVHVTPDVVVVRW